MTRIILASKSPYRKQLLERLGIRFECLDSGLNEDDFKKSLKNPIQLSEALSIAKAQKIGVQDGVDLNNSIIIGSDQVCHIDGQILSKPGNSERAIGQLRFLQGKVHELVTSYAIFYKNEIITNTVITSLKLRNLSDTQIKRYLSTDKPFDCAGSYKIELNGISLMEKITTEDQTAIIGLPLIKLATDLNNIGVLIPPEL
jgi:septum formation protein